MKSRILIGALAMMPIAAGIAHAQYPYPQTQYQPQPQYQTPAPAQSQPQQIVFKSWCPMTKAEGIGRGPTTWEARTAAINACLANGGMSQCCPSFTKQIQ